MLAVKSSGLKLAPLNRICTVEYCWQRNKQSLLHSHLWWTTDFTEMLMGGRHSVLWHLDYYLLRRSNIFLPVPVEVMSIDLAERVD